MIESAFDESIIEQFIVDWPRANLWSNSGIEPNVLCDLGENKNELRQQHDGWTKFVTTNSYEFCWYSVWTTEDSGQTGVKIGWKTKSGRTIVKRCRQNSVRCEFEIQIDPFEQLINEFDSLNHHLVLTQVISSFEDHLSQEKREKRHMILHWWATNLVRDYLELGFDHCTA